MIDAKKSRRELAFELGVTPQAIGMVITGGGLAERKLSFENNQRAAKFLRVSEYWLQTGEDAGINSIPYKEPTKQGRTLALVFDMIPEADTLKRDKAFALATSAIAAVLQGDPLAPK